MFGAMLRRDLVAFFEVARDLDRDISRVHRGGSESFDDDWIVGDDNDQRTARFPEFIEARFELLEYFTIGGFDLHDTDCPERILCESTSSSNGYLLDNFWGDLTRNSCQDFSLQDAIETFCRRSSDVFFARIAHDWPSVSVGYALAHR